MIPFPIGLLSAPAPSPFLLDNLSAAAAVAYSTRKLRGAYAGSALRVRRSNDNAEQDIGFDGSGNLDTTALASFVGANSGYIRTWYDQSGNGVDLAQLVTGIQPRVVNAGANFVFPSGKVAFDIAANNGLVNNLSGFNVTGDSNFSCAAVWGGNTAVSGSKIPVMAGANATQQGWGIGQVAATTDRCFIWGGINADVTGPAVAPRQDCIVRTGNSLAVAVNGGTPASTSGVGTLNIAARLDVGKIGQFSFQNPDAVAELIIWGSAIGSTDQSTVYNSQKTYWGTP